jgi:hypothetical protein
MKRFSIINLHLFRNLSITFNILVWNMFCPINKSNDDISQAIQRHRTTTAFLLCRVVSFTTCQVNQVKTRSSTMYWREKKENDISFSYSALNSLNPALRLRSYTRSQILKQYKVCFKTPLFSQSLSQKTIKFSPPIFPAILSTLDWYTWIVKNMWELRVSSVSFSEKNINTQLKRLIGLNCR